MRSVEQSGGGPQFDSMLNRAALTMRPNGAGRPGTGKRRRSQARDDALRDVPATGSTPAAAAHRRSWGPGDRTRFSHDSGRAASLTELPKIPLAALQSTVPWGSASERPSFAPAPRCCTAANLAYHSMNGIRDPSGHRVEFRAARESHPQLLSRLQGNRGGVGWSQLQQVRGANRRVL